MTGFFVVEEEDIVQALQFAYERSKLVIELSSALRWFRCTGKNLNLSASGWAWCLLEVM